MSRTGSGPKVGLVLQLIGKLWLKFFGWQAVGEVPDVPRAVFIAAPHTTGWDLPFTLGVAWALGMRPSWVGKESLFRFPFGGFMRWLGGVAVVRDQKLSQVESISKAMLAEPAAFLIIAPSGTREKADHWKSGFMHIARAAQVPIMLGFLDYTKKRGGLGPTLTLSGNLKADMDRVRAFYEGIEGKYPDQHTPIRLREEDT